MTDRIRPPGHPFVEIADGSHRFRYRLGGLACGPPGGWRRRRRAESSVDCGAEERKKLERLCRYVARPPLPFERLSRDGDGLVVHQLIRLFRDGTTVFLFEPLDFLPRLVTRAR
jgi:hypothetical protein